LSYWRQPNSWDVLFFLARLENLVVGCGGIAVFDKHAEVKRIYTRPRARGRRVAKALLRKIEDEAVEWTSRSCARKRAPYQREAIGLYERMGFRPRGPFGPYAAMSPGNIETSLFFEKALR
jgi:putative acetyltransferase